MWPTYMYSMYKEKWAGAREFRYSCFTEEEMLGKYKNMHHFLGGTHPLQMKYFQNYRLRNFPWYSYSYPDSQASTDQLYNKLGANRVQSYSWLAPSVGLF